MKRTCLHKNTTCPDVSGIGDQRKLNTDELNIGDSQNKSCDPDNYRDHPAIRKTNYLRMKKVTSYIQLIVFIACVGYLSGCQGGSVDDAATGLALKAFSPTVVMTGGEMTIVGTNLGQVNSIVFPGNIQVTKFEVVTQNQIKLSIPSGISAEGGYLQLVSNEKTLESAVAMRVAKPEIKSLLPGDEVGVGHELSIKGVDMEYTTQIVFPAEADGEVITVEAIDFLRKASEDIKVTVPNGVKNGDITITLVALNGERAVTQPIKVSGNAPSNKLQAGVYYTIWEKPDGLQFPSGWTIAPDVAIKSDYFSYIQKEDYEFKIYFTYLGTQAGGVGIQRNVYSGDCVYYAEADNTKFGLLVERQESREPKKEYVELLTCTTKGPDYATIMGGNEIVLYKIEILFTKLPEYLR